MKRESLVRHLGRSLVLIAAPALISILACPAIADSIEPPSSAPADADYEAEASDSIETGTVEMGFGATGRVGDAPHRRQRLRFGGEGLSASVRDGGGDPLAGAALEAHALGGTLSAGRLRARWGRGLMLGSPADPWGSGALRPGSRLLPPQSGDGLWLRRGERPQVGLIAGRFAHRDLAGASLAAGGVGLAAIAARRAPLTSAAGAHSGAALSSQASLTLERGGGACELAMDRGGRWRAEGEIGRPLGRWNLVAGARGGLEGFRPLAGPSQSGPADAMRVAALGPRGWARLRALAALWRFRSGLAGARAALEVERPMAHHNDLTLGFEEQQGTRRTPSDAGATPAPPGLRQGLWGECRAGDRALALVLRHEAWGERRFARQSVRTVSTVRIEALGPAGSMLRITHSAFRVRSGESLYLLESESDRLVLRALKGAGERTRIEFEAPAAGGRIRAALTLSVTAAGPLRPQWTLDWMRRTRTL